MLGLGVKKHPLAFDLLSESDLQCTRLDTGEVPVVGPLGKDGVENATLQLRGTASGWDDVTIRRL